MRHHRCPRTPRRLDRVPGECLRPRLGDIVALADYVSSFGHGYKRASINIGVVSSADWIKAGYGPGVTVVMTASGGETDPMVAASVNLVDLLAM